MTKHLANALPRGMVIHLNLLAALVAALISVGYAQATVLEQVPSDELSSEEFDDSQAVAPSDAPVSAAPAAKHERLLDQQIRDLRHRFKTKERFRGPYSFSVRTLLNEMVLAGNLMARGLDTIEGLSTDDVRLLAALPTHMPTYGEITSGFGVRRSPFTRRTVMHRGVDIAARAGSPVYATADGVVVFAGWKGPLGRMVMLDHGYGIMTRYAHNSRLLVRRGHMVRRGDLISRVGSSGRSTGSHLHYEVMVQNKPIDPLRFMFDMPTYQDLDSTIATPRSLMASQQHPAKIQLSRDPHTAVLSGAAMDSAATTDFAAMGGEEDEDGELAAMMLPDAPVRHMLLKPYTEQQHWPMNLAIFVAFASLVTFALLSLACQPWKGETTQHELRHDLGSFTNVSL